MPGSVSVGCLSLKLVTIYLQRGNNASQNRRSGSVQVEMFANKNKNKLTRWPIQLSFYQAHQHSNTSHNISVTDRVGFNIQLDI